MQAPDEFAHLDRAYGVAEGYCVAPALTPIPSSIKELTSEFPAKLETQRRLGYGDVWELMHTPLNDSQNEPTNNHAANMYSCFPYLPGAVGIEAGRIAGASPAAILYLTRFANLLAYLAVLYLALGLLPDFQLPLFCLALTPMALNQAASASWDGVAYSTAFLLCAYILKLAWDPAINTLQPNHYLALGAVIAAASLCKTDVWLAPLLVLVPASKFKGIRQKCLVLLGVAALALLVIAGWNFLNRANVANWMAHIKEWRQINFSDNAAFIYQHPMLVLQAAGRTWAARWTEYASEFVGKLGWLVVRLPEWAIWLYFLLLGCVSLTGMSEARLKVGHRLVCLGVVAVATASIFVGMWCAEVPPDYRDGVLHGVGHVPGVQGRYFIPFVLPLLLAFSITWLRVKWKWLLAAAMLVLITINAVALQRIDRTYYLTGPATAYYENRLVKHIGFKGDDAKVYWIHGGQRQWIKHSSWITRHGYRWPDDVVAISDAQLRSIPEGAAIDEE